MRLAFDLDGTVADLQRALREEAQRLFPDIDPSILPRSPASEQAGPVEGEGKAARLSSRQLRELWRVVCARKNFWETLEEIEAGSLARLYRTAQDRRWDLIFLTSRPETQGDSVQAQTHRWLSANGYLTPSIFVVHGSRGKIAAALALDVVVDDRPENCLDVAVDSSARPILVWRDEKGKIPASARQLGIGPVASIAECLDILESLDKPDGDQAGFMDRLKRLLGLKLQPARADQATSPDKSGSPGSRR